MHCKLFTNLFKYKENAEQSPLENYLTELFAYVLGKLLEEKNKTAADILQLFDIAVGKSDFSKITVETQQYFWVQKYSRYARPDIKITVADGRVYFIEVKVESALNQYDDGAFDQIQLYEAIQVQGFKNAGVRTLTKYGICTKGKNYEHFAERHKVRWSKIYALLKNADSDLQNNVLIQNFLYFLEENAMAERKALVYSKEGLENFYAIYDFLEEVVHDFASRESYNTIFDGNKDYFGFDITYYGKKYLWIGLYKNRANAIVVQSYADEKKILTALKKKEILQREFERAAYNDEIIFAELPLSEILAEKDFEQQKEVFDGWLTENAVSELLHISFKILND